jgi:hypothetical protein
MDDPNFSRLLNKTATLYRMSLGTRNTLGEPSKTLATTITVKIAIQFLREKFSIDKDGVTYDVSKKAFINVGDVIAGDYLDVEGVRHLVVGVENESGLDHHLRLFLVEQ